MIISFKKLKKNSQTKMPRKLNLAQKKAVHFNEGPLLVVAGAGTGKTTVITQRLAYLVKNKKAKANEVLALTFTEKAVEEMENRIDDLLSSSYLDLWISTFHSFCERILRDNAFDIGLSPNFKVLNQTSSWLLVRQNIKRFRLNYYRPLGNPSRFIFALLKHFSRCKDEGIYPENYLEFAENFKGLNSQLKEEKARIKEVAKAYADYQNLLLEKGFLDFGDLINYTLKVFRQRKTILEHYQKQFKYILIDEFQDTNWAQYELIKLLALPKNNLTVCADDDQSIYLFRGASFNNVLRFRKDYPKAKEIVLTKNYRSTQNILDLAYKFIQLNNPNRLEYQLNKDREILRKAKDKGVDLSHFKKIDKKLKAVTAKKGIIKYLHFESLAKEAQGVAEEIIKIYQKDSKTKLSDFVVLVRANKSAQPFCQAFSKANIPYQFLALKGLYQKSVIIDVISYFKLLDNYHEGPACYRVLNLPHWEISPKDISKIIFSSRMRAQSIYETLLRVDTIKDLSKKTVLAVKRLLKLLKKHSKLAREGSVSEVFTAFLEDSGYLKYLAKQNNQKSRESLEYLEQFYDKIKLFEASEIDSHLSSFRQQIEWEIEAGEEGSLKFDAYSEKNAVKIMTIHAAKGLEFKYVFLVSLVDKHFPTIAVKEPIEIPEPLIKEVIPKGDIHLQEERRLFYVGLTRAKRGIFLTSGEDYGGQRRKKISRFLQELGFKGKIRKKAEPKLSFENKNAFKKDKSFSFRRKIKISHLSYTQLAAFEKCPLQYKFAHILKIPVKGKASFTFGKVMHHTLFEFVSLASEKIKNRQPIPPFRSLLEFYNKNWLNQWYLDREQRSDYKKLGEKSLRKFYKDFASEKPMIKFIDEKPFLERGFNLKMGSYHLTGQIDRIDELEDGEVEIIDYKTGNPKKALSREDKEQLLIYQMAVENILGLKIKRLTYYYLNNNQTISFLGTQKEKESLRQKILAEAKKIESGKFSPHPGWQCQYCDFREICEFRENHQ